MIRNKSGKIIGSYEVGPFEIGQDLVLECEVKGGTIIYFIKNIKYSRSLNK